MRDLGTVIVTGAASGLGAAVADAVHKAGGAPVAFDRREPASDYDFVEIDLADTRRVEQAVAEVARRHGGLDGVVTAAGMDSPGQLVDTPAELWERIVAVNLLGTAAIARAAVPHLQASEGRIVTVASTLGHRALPAASAYCASKFGVVGFTRALAAETAGRVGVTLLSPGGMDTAFFEGRAERYRPGPDAMLNRPEDVAATVVFALQQPAGCEVRELVVCPAEEPSWP